MKRPSRPAILLGTIAVLLAVPTAHATILYWDLNGAAANTAVPVTGTWDGTNLFWNDSATGTGGIPRAATTNADDLVFSSGISYTSGTVTLSGARVASSITFEDNIAVTLSGGTSLTLGGSGGNSGVTAFTNAVDFFGNPLSNTISTSIILDANTSALTFSNFSTSGLTLSTGTITGSAAGTQTINLTSTNSGSITLAGNISNGTGGGTVALNVNSSGTGTAYLSGANTFSGGVTLTSGTLQLGSTTALGTGPLTIFGGTLNSGWINAGNNAVTINGDFTGSLNLGTGAISLGTLPGTTRTITTNSGTLTLGGVIADGTTANSLTKAGTATLELSGANTFSGGVVLNAGTLALGHTNALGTGPLTISGGTLSSNVANLVIAGNNPVTINANVTFTGTQNLNLGTGAVSLGTQPGTTRSIITSSGSGVLALGGVISNGTTADSLSIAGSGRLLVSGQNLYTGNTVLTNGTLLLGADPVGSVGAVASSPIGRGTLVFQGGGIASDGTANRTIINPVIFTGNGFFGTGGIGEKITISSNADLGSGVRTLTVNNDAQFDGILSGVSGGIIKSGPGLLLLNNPGNTYGGGTTVTRGTLRALVPGSIPSGSNLSVLGNFANETTTLEFTSLNHAVGALTMGEGNFGSSSLVALGNATLTLGGDVTYNGNIYTSAGATISGTAGGNLSLGAATRTFAIGDSSSAFCDLTVSAGISGSGVGLIKTGTGTLALTAANSYTGATTVSGGTLLLYDVNAYAGGTTITSGTLMARNVGALGSGSVTVGANAALNYVAVADAPLSIGGSLGITGGTSTVIGGSLGTTANSARISVTGSVVANGAVKVNVFPINGFTPLAGTNAYTLVHGTAGSTLNGAAYSLGMVYNNTNFRVGTPTATATDLTVPITSATALTTAYWKGGLTGATNVWAASNGNTQSNWVAASGGANQALVPGAGADVIFSNSIVTTSPNGSTLGADMTIRSLTQLDTTNSVVLNKDGFTLTITPASSSTGITIAKLSQPVTVNPNLVLGAAQTWSNNTYPAFFLEVNGHVSNGANLLTVGGSSSTKINGVIGNGPGGLTKTGSGTLTLGGANTYSGVTTVTGGTLQMGGSGAAGAGAINASSAIILSNNATLKLSNTTTQRAVNRLGDNAGITSYGGSLSYDNTSGVGGIYAETTGAVTLASGHLNVVLPGGGGNQQTLTLSGLTQTGTATATFSAGSTGPNASTDRIKVTGAVATPAGEIIGPWVTTGTTSGFQTDYAIYNGSSMILPAAIAASAESAWTSGSNVTLAGSTTLTGNRALNSLRFTGAAGTLALENSNLETFGILNGSLSFAPRTLTITSTTGVVRQPGTAPASLYVAASNNIGASDGGITISAPIQDHTGALTLVKSGASTLTLSGANTFSGGVSLNAGVLNLGSATALGTGSLNIFGGTLDSSVTNLVNAGNNPVTINGDLTFAGTQNLNLGTGAVSLGTLAGVSRTITTTSSTASLTLGGAISNGTTADSLIKAGPGALILSGANTFGGGLTLTAGTLTFGGPNALGTGVLEIFGGTLDSSVVNLVNAGNNPVTINGSFTFSGTQTLHLGSGPISLGTESGTARTITNSGILTLGGAVSNGTTARSLVKEGPGTLVLAGTNTYSGGITINDGATFLTGANVYAGVTAINNGTLTLSGATGTITASSAITLSNNASLTLSNTSIQGTVNRLGNSAGITFNGGNLLYSNMAASGAIYAETTGTVAFANGQSNLVLDTDMAGGGGNRQTLTLAGLTRTGTATATYSAPATGPNLATNIIIVMGAAQTPAGRIIGAWATTGTGTSFQTDYAIYDASFRILPANIAVSAESAWTTTTSTYTLGAGTTLTGTRSFDSLRYIGATGTLALAGNHLETFGILNGGTGTLIISSTSGVVRQLGTAAANLYVTTGSSDLTISAPIQNNAGALKLVKSGASMLTLSGPNTFSGGAALNAGTLRLGSATALGTGPLTIVGGSLDSSVPNLVNTGNNLVTINGDFTFAGTQNLTLGTGAISLGTLPGTTRTITTNGSASLTLGGGISNGTTATSITKAGSGTLILSGDNFSLGGVTLKAGTLSLASSNALAYNTLLTINGGTLESRITGLSVSSMTVNGDFTFTGSQPLSIGVLGAGSISLGPTPGATRTITTDGSNSLTLSGGISNGTTANSLTKAGSGTLILSGAGSYTGATTVSAGKLTFSNQIVPSASVSIASGATLEYATTNFNRQTATTIAGGGRLLKTGSNVIYFGGSGLVNWQLGTGALIDIQQGVIVGGNNIQDVWTSNLSDLNIATGAGFAGVEANVRINALTGGGMLSTGFSTFPAGYSTFTIGVNNGGDVFSGSIADGTPTLQGLTVATGSGTGSITKVGTGMQTLSGTSTYTGTTTVNGGELRVTGSIATSALTTVSSGILSGTGTVGALRTAGGTLAPGTSAGTLSSGSVDFSGGTLAIELASASVADRLNVIGTAGLSADTALAISLLGGYDPQVGDNWVLVQNDGTDAFGTGAFHFTSNNLPLLDNTPFTVGAKTFMLQYNAGTGNDVVLTAVVPEPTTGALLLAGLPLLLRRRRDATTA